MPGLPTYTTGSGRSPTTRRARSTSSTTTRSATHSRTSSRSPRTSRPYEKVAVGKNRQYVLEAIRAEGTSEWRTAPHDEFALVMDGEVEIRLRKLGAGRHRADRRARLERPRPASRRARRWAASSLAAGT